MSQSEVPNLWSKAALVVQRGVKAVVAPEGGIQKLFFVYARPSLLQCAVAQANHVIRIPPSSHAEAYHSSAARLSRERFVDRSAQNTSLAMSWLNTWLRSCKVKM